MWTKWLLFWTPVSNKRFRWIYVFEKKNYRYSSCDRHGCCSCLRKYAGDESDTGERKRTAAVSRKGDNLLLVFRWGIVRLYQCGSSILRRTEQWSPCDSRTYFWQWISGSYQSGDPAFRSDTGYLPVEQWLSGKGLSGRTGIESAWHCGNLQYRPFFPGGSVCGNLWSEADRLPGLFWYQCVGI